MFSLTFVFSRVEVLFWIVQLLLIAHLLTKGRVLGRNASSGRTSGMACLLVLALAWLWRISYQFVLGSTGFYLQEIDDASRWMQSWTWARHAYVISWDGNWLGGTFYLHGMAMRLIADPLTATKFVAVFYSALPLAGIFVLTLGLYRDRLLACAAAIFCAPWWQHQILASGTMAELPVAGFAMLGGGCVLLAVGEAAPRRRRGWFAAGAMFFLLATSFHSVAWMILAAALAVMLYAALRRWIPLTLIGWILFALVSSAFCFLWMIGCAIKFGDPLHFIKVSAEHNFQSFGHLPLGQLLPAYPDALLRQIWVWAPLAIFGLIWALCAPRPSRPRVIALLAVVAISLVVLVLTMIRGGQGTPYRATLALATALMPIALAPLRFAGRDPAMVESSNPPANSRASDPRPSLVFSSPIAALLLALACGAWAADNHQRLLTDAHQAPFSDPDEHAVATWLRRQILHPQEWETLAGHLPMRIWLPDYSRDPRRGLEIMFVAGNPALFDLRADPQSAGLDSLRPEQTLLARGALSDPRLAEITRVASYYIYRRKP